MLEFLDWLFVTGLGSGFFTGRHLAGKKGQHGKLKSLIIPFIRDYKLHLHHWFISLLILLYSIKIGFYHSLLYGFNIGLIFQGLTYPDWYKLIRKFSKTLNSSSQDRF